MVALAAFLVAFGLTTWQSDLVLEIVNAPLPGDMEPITLGPAEPFMVTLKNAAYAALLLGLPVFLVPLMLLYELSVQLARLVEPQGGAERAAPA